jgi:hypothetical protein
MRNAVNLVYLAAYICLTLVQYAHPPAVNQLPYAYVWAIASFSYPFFLALTQRRAGFWRGLLTIFLISVIAQAVEAVVYLLRTRGFQNGDTDAIVRLGFYLIGPLGTAAVWFPIGYLASWLLFRQRLNLGGSDPNRPH